MTLDDLFELLGSRGITILAVMLGLLWPLFQKLLRQNQNQAPAPEPKPAKRLPPSRPAARPKPPAPAPVQDKWAEPRRQITQALTDLEKDSLALGDEVMHERANRRFREVLTEWIPERARLLRAELQKSKERLDSGLVQGVNALVLVRDEIRDLVEQRRDKRLLPLLGDADSLADACYSPIVTFCQAEGLPLSSAYPATQLAKVDLSIWTGFAPTSVAPIFLPPSFFETAAYWPAIAHEIGHDFLISVRGLEKKLREEIGVHSEDAGSRPLRFGPDGIDVSELHRVLGAWFEEIFSDVFGTLMCGPAFVTSMSALFAARQDAREVLVVATDPRGRYDVHPPRHLRVFVGCRVLERASLDAEAAQLWARWNQQHGFLPQEPIGLLFPMGGRLISLPFEIFAEAVAPVVDRLYRGPLSCLDGVGLSDVSGLDFGPHENAEAHRAKDALLAGRVPAQRDPRAIIGGAVLAWSAEPEKQARILELAREAIPACGTAEHHPDVYQPSHLAAQLGGLDLSPHVLVEAIVAGELMRRPADRRSRPRSKRRSAGAR